MFTGVTSGWTSSWYGSIEIANELCGVVCSCGYCSPWVLHSPSLDWHLRTHNITVSETVNSKLGILIICDTDTFTMGYITHTNWDFDKKLIRFTRRTGRIHQILGERIRRFARQALQVNFIQCNISRNTVHVAFVIKHAFWYTKTTSALHWLIKNA